MPVPRCSNIYHPPEGGGDPREGERHHLDLVREVFATGDDGERIRALPRAHAGQNPAVKINHARLEGRRAGYIGKGQQWAAGMRGAIGEWELQASFPPPAAAMEKFNAQIASGDAAHQARANEGTEVRARFDRYAFYEWLKEITAEPPGHAVRQ